MPAHARRARQAPAGPRLPAALDTLRRLARVLSLLALDFAGDLRRIFTALCLKAVAAATPRRRRSSWQQAKDYVSVRLPGRRRCCSRARGCTPSAPCGPG